MFLKNKTVKLQWRAKSDGLLPTQKYFDLVLPLMAYLAFSVG
jgi:hypothetical protein